MTVARCICNRGPTAVKLIKQMLRRMAELTPREAREQEIAAFLKCLEPAEGMAAFLE